MGTPRPPRLLILYGSETGNAQDAAERIAREARQRHYNPSCLAFDAYDLQALADETCVVFVVATTGQGEAPANMRNSWRLLLRKSLPPTALAGLRVAVFGLGDSGYIQYNVMAKKLDRRLVALGAHPVLPKGLGDDQAKGGYEAALDAWLPQLWTALRVLIPLAPGYTDPIGDQHGPLEAPRLQCTWLPHNSSPPTPYLPADDPYGWTLQQELEARAALESLLAPDIAHNNTQVAPMLARMISNTRITSANHFQDTRHVVLSCPKGLHYQPGDVLHVLPRQPANAVHAVLRHCGWAWNDHVCIRNTETGASFEAAVGPLVAGVVDISAASPRRFWFEVLSHMARAPHEAERLQYFSSAEGRDDLYNYNQREGRTLLEVLTVDFPSAAPPLEWLLQAGPRLQARQFSIASSPLAHPEELHLTVAVVSWTTPYKRHRQGLCSSWLASLLAGAPVPVWTTPGSLSLPRSPATPLVLVGPGTGVAPLRSLIHQRAAMAAAGHPVGPVLMFFGCRSASGDLYYQQEWEQPAVQGVLYGGGVAVACSRDGPRKVYVQDRIREHGAAVWRLLEDGAHVCVCGSANKMPQGVAAAVRDVVQEHGGMDTDAAAAYVKRLETSRRYSVEAWS